ncbi:MAG TPA: glycosyltransferase, partial [Kofleriaceae bacterium]|nr:glycosyltransferase [Kofleriaceae bacterium]
VGRGPAGVPPPALPGVTFHGAARSEHEVARHLAACDALVAPATGQESFGIVLLEAMAAGRPIVCSDIEGFREVVTPANAHLVRPGDPIALAAAISDLAAAPAVRRAMAGENRHRVDRFAWTSLVQRVRAEYVAAIAETSARLRAAS